MKKACSKCKIEKSLDLFYTKTEAKDGKASACKLCAKMKDREYKAKNKDKIKVTKKRYAQRNREKVNAASRQWQRDNPEKRRQMAADWYQRNKERKRETDREWTRKNRAKKNYLTAQYRASKRQRTPAWLTEGDKQTMKDFYQVAQMLSEVTGVQYEVDHIIPLNGKNVCGLHCPDNLQILTAEENRKKTNKLMENVI